MWFLTSHFLVFVTGGLLGGLLAWQWRSARAWKREVIYKREWSDKLHSTEAYSSKRLVSAREEAAAALEARNAKILSLTAEVHSLEGQLPRGRRQARRNGSRSTAPPAVAPTRNGPKQAVRPRSGRTTRRSRTPSPHRDDLRQIKGIGPVFERQLHELGYRRFVDIASWGPDDLAKVTRKLDVRGDRIGRENWIAQARQLVAKESDRPVG